MDNQTDPPGEPRHGGEQLTRRERRELKKQQKEQDRLVKEKQLATKEKRKSMLTWVGIAAAVFVVGFLMFSLFRGNGAPDNEGPYSKGQVHWHASLKVFVCGEERLMPAPTGEHHLGLPLLHTHEDRLIHIEGVIQRPEDITLGRYMSVIGRSFEDDELLDKKNGDLCDGKPGIVKLLIDGKESPDLSHHVIKDGESYELRFEP